MSDQVFEQIADTMEALNNRLRKVEKSFSEESTDTVARERRAAQRERRLLSDERTASEASNAAAAESLMAIKTTLDEQIAAATAELGRKEASAKTGQLLMQEMRAELQSMLIDQKTQINELEQANLNLQQDLAVVSRDLQDYKSRLGQAKADAKGSVLEEARIAAGELSDQKLAAEVSRQLRIQMRAESENA